MFLATFDGERPNCNLSIPVVSIDKYTYLFCQKRVRSEADSTDVIQKEEIE